MPSCCWTAQAEETKLFNPGLKGKDTCNTFVYELKSVLFVLHKCRSR